MNIKMPTYFCLLFFVFMMAGCGDDQPAPRNTIRVTAVWPGASLQEIEEHLALPLEKAALRVTSINDVSTRIFNQQCVMTLTLKDNAEIASAANDIKNAADVRTLLPEDAEDLQIEILPQLHQPTCWLLWTPAENEAAPILGQAEQLRQKALRTPHIGDIKIFGAPRRFVEVVVDPEKLPVYDVTLDGIEKAIDESLDNGSFDDGLRSPRKPPEAKDRILRSQKSPAAPDPDKLEELPLHTTPEGRVVYLRDVARVSVAMHFDARAQWNGRDVVVLGITPTAAERVDEVRRTLREHLPDWNHDLQTTGRLSLAFNEDERRQAGPDAQVKLTLPDGADKTTQEEIARRAQSLLQKIMKQSSVLVIQHTNDPSTTELYVRGNARDIAPAQFARKIYAALTELPGVNVRVINLRSPAKTSPEALSVVVQLLGPDLSELREWSEKVAAEARGLDNILGVAIEGASITPELQINLKIEKAAAFGLSAATIGSFVHSRVFSDGPPAPGERPVSVRLAGGEKNPRDLSKLRIPTPNGQSVPFSSVADVELVAQPREILRWNSFRMARVVIQADSLETRDRISEKLCRMMESSHKSAKKDGYRYHIVTDEKR